MTLTKRELRYSIEQETAIAMCCDLALRIVGVTGGAGTGKTSVLGAVHRELALVLKRRNVVLCAPTGRAAKRIQELTGITAQTIHRLLEFPKPDDDIDEEESPLNEPKRNRQNPLPQRCVIVDEASMLSPTLHRQLLEALPTNGLLRLFGDNNQLPPVEDGKPPFLTYCQEATPKKPVIELTYNYRSDDAIVSNALRILKGQLPVANDRFHIIYSDQPLKQLVHLVERDFADDDHQIIMPTRNGDYGTARVNPSLQLKLNPIGEVLRLERKKRHPSDPDVAPLAIRGGDKFLWIENDYKLNIFNGEIGRIGWVNPEDGSLQIVTPERSLVVPAFITTFSPYHGSYIHYDPRKKIELGYAITTHKSQGSEFDTVIYCMTARAPFLIGRRNFYTGITRAKNRVIIICDRRAMGYAVRRGISEP